MSRHRHTWPGSGFIWVLEIPTPVLLLTQRASLPTEPSPRPWANIFILIKNLYKATAWECHPKGENIQIALGGLFSFLSRTALMALGEGAVWGREGGRGGEGLARRSKGEGWGVNMNKVQWCTSMTMSQWNLLFCPTKVTDLKEGGGGGKEGKNKTVLIFRWCHFAQKSKRRTSEQIITNKQTKKHKSIACLVLGINNQKVKLSRKWWLRKIARTVKIHSCPLQR